MIDNVKRLYQKTAMVKALYQQKEGYMMAYDEFIKEYGTAWKRIFEIGVWKIPTMRDWLHDEWKAVYNSIIENGIEGTSELWLMMAHKDAMESINDILA